MIPKKDVPLAYNGESAAITLANSQLQSFGGNGYPVLISGEKGTGKYRAAKWVYQFRSGLQNDLPIICLQSESELSALRNQKLPAAYLLVHETYAILHLPKLLQLDIPQLYIGIISSQPFTLHYTEVNTAHIPALRDRVLDIPILTQVLLRKLEADNHVPPKPMNETQLQQLQRKPLPGNMVELRFLLEKWLMSGVLD